MASSPNSTSASLPEATPVRPTNYTAEDRSPVHTPPRPTIPLPSNSPVRPTPTKLPHFLAHAQDNLDVTNARLLEYPLKAKGYGPDIFPLVKDGKLLEMNISDGDVIRLKRGATEWWNSPAAKRPRAEVDADLRRDAQRKVRFERVWHDGTRKTFWGPQIRAADPGEIDMNNDYEDFFFCEAAGGMMKIPPGFVAEEEAEEEAADLFQ